MVLIVWPFELPSPYSLWPHVWNEGVWMLDTGSLPGLSSPPKTQRQNYWSPGMVQLYKLRQFLYFFRDTNKQTKKNDKRARTYFDLPFVCEGASQDEDRYLQVRSHPPNPRSAGRLLAPLLVLWTRGGDSTLTTENKGVRKTPTRRPVSIFVYWPSPQRRVMVSAISWHELKLKCGVWVNYGPYGDSVQSQRPWKPAHPSLASRWQMKYGRTSLRSSQVCWPSGFEWTFVFVVVPSHGTVTSLCWVSGAELWSRCSNDGWPSPQDLWEDPRG